MPEKLIKYPELLGQIKQRIRQGQTRAIFSANAEMISMYWDIGRMLHERQKREGWGAGVIPRLSKDIHNELPEIKGFSERNIGYMIRFAREYDASPILQRPVAKLQSTENRKGEKVPQSAAKISGDDIQSIVQQLVAKIPWGHNILLIEKIKDIATRVWYMQQALDQGWSKDILLLMIKSCAYERQGKTVSNFKTRLPTLQSNLVQRTLKDPYIFDFLTLEEPFHERELETSLVRHLEKFLLELGSGFAFVGRQYHLDIGEEDFYIDLLFYHLKLRRYVVIDLKKGGFKPEYAGKMNFYCNVIDQHLRHKNDKPTIGIILCQDKKTVLAEYTLRGIAKPIGISEYELTRALPTSFRSALPSIKDIEAELNKASPKKNEKTP